MGEGANKTHTHSTGASLHTERITPMIELVATFFQNLVEVIGGAIAGLVGLITGR